MALRGSRYLGEREKAKFNQYKTQEKSRRGKRRDERRKKSSQSPQWRQDRAALL